MIDCMLINLMFNFCLNNEDLEKYENYMNLKSGKYIVKRKIISFKNDNEYAIKLNVHFFFFFWKMWNKYKLTKVWTLYKLQKCKNIYTMPLCVPLNVCKEISFEVRRQRKNKFNFNLILFHWTHDIHN